MYLEPPSTMDKDSEDVLSDILNKVNSWLKFAEAKNSFLLAFNGAALWTVIKPALDNTQSYCSKIYYLNVGVFAVVGIIFTLIGILAQSTSPLKYNFQGGKRNLFFFKHIATFSPEEYLRLIEETLGLSPQKSSSAFSLFISEQIIANSRITCTKFDYSRLATWMTAWALLTPIIAIPLWAFITEKLTCHNKDKDNFSIQKDI